MVIFEMLLKMYLLYAGRQDTHTSTPWRRDHSYIYCMEKGPLIYIPHEHHCHLQPSDSYLWNKTLGILHLIQSCSHFRRILHSNKDCSILGRYCNANVQRKSHMDPPDEAGNSHLKDEYTHS